MGTMSLPVSSAADKTADVYLVHNHGTRYDPRPHDSEIPLNVTLEPGQVVRTRRIFELPVNAQNIGLLGDGGSFGACPMIGESVRKQRTRADNSKPIRIFPVPTRVEYVEKERLETARASATKTLFPFLDHLPE